MPNSTYQWTIESIDPTTDTMLVNFNFDGRTVKLNLPAPDDGADVAAWVDKFAPRQQWQLRSVAQVSVGLSGQALVEPPAPTPAPAPEAPVVNGSFNEEYLRALIYQVLEEINEAQAAPAPTPAPEPSPPAP